MFIEERFGAFVVKWSVSYFWKLFGKVLGPNFGGWLHEIFNFFVITNY